MNDQLLIRAAREAEWSPSLEPPNVIRARAQRRRRIRRIGAALAFAVVIGVGMYAVLPERSSTTVADPPSDEPDRVGPVLMTDVPDGWQVTPQTSSPLVARACAGPTAQACAVVVLAAAVPTRDSGIDWISVLTEPCASPKSTTVLSQASDVPAGAAQEYSLECDTGQGVITNTAWVLEAGVAVIPASADHIDEGRQLVDGMRFEGGQPSLPPVEPSLEPSAGE